MLFLLSLLFVICAGSASLPQIDNTWNNLNCPGCICTPPYDKCLCSQNCTGGNFFWIMNIDPWNPMAGRLCHDITVDKLWFVVINYSFPSYDGGIFKFCVYNKHIRCFDLTKDKAPLSVLIDKGDRHICFVFKLNNAQVNVMRVSNITWIDKY